MLDSFVSRYQAGVTGSTELRLQSHFSHLWDGAAGSCSVSPCVAEGTLPPRVAACGRLKAAVMVQEHCFGEGISELNSSNMPSGLTSLSALVLLTAFGLAASPRAS